MKEVDAKLIKKAKRGDVDAFCELISEHRIKIYNIAYRLIGNHMDAEDITQEALIEVYKDIKNLRSNFESWVYKIVLTTFKDYLRKAYRRYEIVKDDIEVDKDISFEEILYQQDLKEEVEKALENLQDEFKMVIILRDMEGFDYEKISEMLELPVGTVKSRIARGREMLKKEIIKRRSLK